MDFKLEEVKSFEIVMPMLDYPLAFAALGLAGLFKKYPNIGIGIGLFRRFIASFLLGIVFFAEWTSKGVEPYCPFSHIQWNLSHR